MRKRSILAWGKAFVLLLAVYLPTFAVVSGILGPTNASSPASAELMTAAFPLVIAVSLLIALIMILLVGRQQFRSYGFQSAPGRTLLHALALGVVIGLALRGIVRIFGIEEPSLFEGLAIWQVIVYFWVSAPIQEEIIFRGLIQTTLQRGIPAVVAIGRWRLSIAALGSGIAFAMVHFGLVSAGASWGATIFVGASALLLGLLAGQLRWQTGSLLPAILIHAMFNVTSSVW